jgi:hypothetical protein
MTFSKWLDTLVEEKGYNIDTLFEINGPRGMNIIPLSVTIEAIKSAPKSERDHIKNNLVKIDFSNGDCLDYFRHLSQAIAV